MTGIRPRTCGVYALVAPSGSQYVGSSYWIENRVREHRTEALAGRHSNEPLKNAFEKYGDLQVKILIVCRPEDRIMYEQLCIDALCPEYNCSAIASRPDFNEALRRKASESHKRHHREHPERDARHSEIMKTKGPLRAGSKWSEESKAIQKAGRLAWYAAHPEARAEQAQRAAGNKHNLGKTRSQESRARSRASRQAYLARRETETKS